MYIERKLKEQIKYSLKYTSVTAILGARQVGKTTLAKNILEDYEETIYIDLEKASHLTMLHDPEQYFELNKNVSLICIDEIQLKPNIFTTLRSFVDENPNFRFLILGSASPALLKQSSESLAGRIFYYELNPFSYKEIATKKTIHEYHLLGGFPKSILSSEEKISVLWLENFIKTYLERDLRMFGYNIPPATLRRLWIMLAHLNGQLVNYATLSNSMGLDQKTIKKYIDILHNTYMIRMLQPFYINVKKRIIKSPKLYIRDTGILHNLLGVTNYNSLYSNPVFGMSWESLVIENIIVKYESWQPFFYRTSNGAEIDLILLKGNKIIAIEIKASSAPKVSRGFWNAIKDIEATHVYIIAQVNETYPYKKDILVYNLEEFCKLEI